MGRSCMLKLFGMEGGYGRCKQIDLHSAYCIQTKGRPGWAGWDPKISGELIRGRAL